MLTYNIFFYIWFLNFVESSCDFFIFSSDLIYMTILTYVLIDNFCPLNYSNKNEYWYEYRLKFIGNTIQGIKMKKKLYNYYVYFLKWLTLSNALSFKVES